MTEIGNQRSRGKKGRRDEERQKRVRKKGKQERRKEPEWIQ